MMSLGIIGLVLLFGVVAFIVLIGLVIYLFVKK